MKPVIIPSAVLVVILSVSLWAGQYVQTRTDYWNALLLQARSEVEEERWEVAEETLSAALADWEARENFLHIMMEHAVLEDTRSLLAGVQAACQERDGDDFHILLAQLLCQLEHLAETQSVSLQNIL